MVPPYSGLRRVGTPEAQNKLRNGGIPGHVGNKFGIHLILYPYGKKKVYFGKCNVYFSLYAECTKC